MSDPAKYRTKDEEKEYKERDPLGRVEAKLLDKKMASQEDIDAIKARVKEEIDACIDFAEKSNFPAVEELYTDNYVQKDYPFIKNF